MSLFKDTVVTFISKAATIVLGIGLACAAAWLLGPEGRGQLAIYNVLAVLLVLVTSVGVEMAGAYYAGTRKYGLPEVIMGILIITAVSLLAATAIGYLLWIWQPGFIAKITGRGLIISVIFVPAVLLFTSIWYIHMALGHMKTYCLGEIINGMIALTGVLVLCWNTRIPEYVILSRIIGLLITLVIFLFVLARKNKIVTFGISWRCIKDLYKYGVKYCLGRIADFFSGQIGTVIIIFLGSTAEIGYFAVAVALTSKLVLLPSVLLAVLLSRVVEHQENSIGLVARAVRVTFWMLLFVSLVLGAFCKPIVMVALSPKFLPSVVPILIMLPGMTVKCCSKVLGIYFNGVGRPEINSIALTASVPANIILMYFLLPVYGIVGAALATTLGYLVEAVALLIYYKLAFNHPLSLLVPRTCDIAELFSVVYKRLYSLRK